MTEGDSRFLLSLQEVDVASLHVQIERLRASGSVSQSSLSEISTYIQGETSKLKWIIGSLLEHLNQLAHISKLPDGVLQEIFHCVANADTLKLSIKPAITLGVVCRRWRRIVLDTLSLWGRINDKETRWLSCALDRSGNAPLLIRWQPTLDCGDDIDEIEDMGIGMSTGLDETSEHLRSLLSNMHRVEDLNLTLESNELEDLEDLLLQPSPMLQYLCLTAMDRATWEPTDALATHSPNLRSLSLDNVLLPWPTCASSWKKLVHLRIDFTDDLERVRARMLTLDDLIDMFAAFPLLETAIFHRAIGDLTSVHSLADDEVEALVAGSINMPSQERRIAARLLRVFEFGVESIRSAFELARHLDFPPSCTVICSCGHVINTSACYALALLSVLSQGRVAARVRLGGQPGFHIRALFATSEEGDTAPSIALTYINPSPQVSDAVASRIWHLQPLKTVHTLQLVVTVQNNSTAVSWADITKMCTDLRHLVLETAGSVSSLVKALNSENADAIVPSTLRRITMSKNCQLGIVQEKALADALRRRHVAGWSLRTLDVFSRYRKEVIWDGIADKVRVKGPV